MNLTIKETVGETTLEFNMSGDYEEVLALVTELGYCADSFQDCLDESVRCVIAEERRPGGLLDC